MNIFDNSDFYPTPTRLGKEMIEPYKDKIRKGEAHIYDPSAGSGTLLEIIQEYKYEREKAQFIWSF